MVHDFATAKRETKRRQPGANSSSLDKDVDTLVSSVERADDKVVPAVGDTPLDAEPERSNGVKVAALWLKLAVVGLFLGLVVVVIQYVLDSEPQADETPDTIAKQEYQESVLANDTPAEPDMAVVVEPTATTVEEPPPPETRESAYHFYETLPKGSPIPTVSGAYIDPNDAQKEKPLYVLQAASFRDENDATRFSGKLQTNGLPAFIQKKVSSSGEYWYAVSVGPYRNSSKLNKAYDMLVGLSNTMPSRVRVRPDAVSETEVLQE